jgi:hypothetical protein
MQHYDDLHVLWPEQSGASILLYNGKWKISGKPFPILAAIWCLNHSFIFVSQKGMTGSDKNEIFGVH